jgi:hypothetical protein
MGLHPIVVVVNEDPFDHVCGIPVSRIVIAKGGIYFANGIAMTRDSNHVLYGIGMTNLEIHDHARVRGTVIGIFVDALYLVVYQVCTKTLSSLKCMMNLILVGYDVAFAHQDLGNHGTCAPICCTKNTIYPNFGQMKKNCAFWSLASEIWKYLCIPVRICANSSLFVRR